jgi:hypothetical protein
MLHGRQVGEGASNADERLRRPPPLQPRELRGDARDGRVHDVAGDGPVEAVALGEPDRSHVEAEALVDTVAVAERELGSFPRRSQTGRPIRPDGR